MAISIIIFSVILFLGGGRILYRVSGGNYASLVRWSIKCSTFCLLLSIIATLYDDYQANKSLDILIGVFSGKSFRNG